MGERLIEPYGDEHRGGVDQCLVGIYGLTFPAADTLAELADVEAALEKLGFWVSRSVPGELFATT